MNHQPESNGSVFFAVFLILCPKCYCTHKNALETLIKFSLSKLRSLQIVWRDNINIHEIISEYLK